MSSSCPSTPVRQEFKLCSTPLPCLGFASKTSRGHMLAYPFTMLFRLNTIPDLHPDI